MMQLRDCSAGKYVTHTGGEAKEEVEVAWRAPKHFFGTVIVYATVVKDYSTYWVKFPSHKVTVSKLSGEGEPESEPESGPEPESEPNSEPESEPGKGHNGQSAPLTPGGPNHEVCGTHVGCFGFGPTLDTKCVESRNCDFFALWKQQGENKFLFQLEFANNAQGYLALGFSEDQSMGQEVVLLCSSKKVEWYWNSGKSAPSKIGDIEGEKVVAEDGKVRCEFETDKVVNIGDKSVDLSKEVFLLMAKGAFNGAPSYHNKNGRLVSDGKVKLHEHSLLGSKSEILMQFHGVFMLVAWLGFAGTGMLFARYFRQTWVGKQIQGKDRWFQAHRLLMGLTVIFSLMGLVFAAIYLNGFGAITDGGSHPIVGLFTLIFSVINPVMALFRPHPGTDLRPIFNWAHWAVGNSAHLLALVTIFLASNAYSYLVSSESTSQAWIYLLLVYVFIHVVIHVILSILWARSKKEPTDPNANATPMNAMTDLYAPAEKEVVAMDAQNSNHRKILLSVYIFATTIITIVLISAIFKAF